MKSDLATHHIKASSALKETALKYHVLVAWVAVILNPLWVIGDYFNVPDHFNDFLIFRIVVSIATLLPIVLKNHLKNHPEIIAFVPFIGISVQNAYMYSVMDIVEIQKHTFAYIALFIGAGMFVLWKPVYSIIVVLFSFLANIVFFHFNGIIPLDQVLINGGLLTATVALFTILLIQTRTSLTRKEITARLALENSNNELEVKNQIIAKKNKDIRDSINYAKQIQLGILPSEADLTNALGNHFVLYKPKDIVSGDFYWALTTTTSDTATKLSIFAAVDCTGHGVPGAFMSMVGKTLLNQTIKNPDINSPADALNYLSSELPKNLKSHQTNNSIKDGMDISLCALDHKNKKLFFAGANNPCWIIRNGELYELAPDKFSISANPESKFSPFTNKSFDLNSGDLIYIFTDGFADQFGQSPAQWSAYINHPDYKPAIKTSELDDLGLQPKTIGKKLKYKPFKELLMKHSKADLDIQKHAINTYFEEWRGLNEQTDDVCIICVKIEQDEIG